MYPLAGPPPSAGLYLVRNTKTRQVYVGQTVDLKRRHAEWRFIIATGLRAPNPAFVDALMASNRNDWFFEVIMECDAADLKRGEEKLIAKFVADIGPLCLNDPNAGVRKTRPSKLGSVPLSIILDEHGERMTYAQVAERLGVTKESVAKRLIRLRKAGRCEFHIGDLPARQQRLPSKILG